MSLRLESAALEPPAGNFDRKYWDEGVEKRDGRLVLDEYRETFDRFFAMPKLKRGTVLFTTRMLQAWEYLNLFHSSDVLIILFGEKRYREIAAAKKEYKLNERMIRYKK